MRTAILTMLALVVPLIGPVATGRTAERLSLDFAAQRWQLLPPTIQAVFVGPDGRTWYQLAGEKVETADRGEAEIRTALEAEYRQPAPQISGAALALLEPGGRAWFYVKEGREVWGFDGERWIERKATPGSKFVGDCPTRGALPDNLSNRVAGGKTWLRDEQGIHILSGETWSYMALCPKLNTLASFPRFAVSPGGQFAVALTPKTAQRSPFLQNPDLWVCEEGSGEWRQVALAWTERDGPIGTFCVTDAGQFHCVHGGGQLRQTSLAAARDGRELAPQFIAQLDDDSFPVRERAYEKLKECAEHIQPLLAAALKAAKSPETKQRLQSLLIEDRAAKANAHISPGSVGVTIGSCTVRNVKSIYQDERGRLFVFAQAIVQGADPPVNGLAIVDRTGQAALHAFDQHPVNFVLGGDGNTPILTAAGDGLWLSRANDGGTACRLDLSAKLPAVLSPDSQFRVVRAVADNGQVFLARRQADPLARGAQAMGLFAPQVADRRPALTRHTEAVRMPGYVIASDGALWASRNPAELSRYDGREWEVVHRQKQSFLTPVLAGRDNVVLASINSGSNSDYILMHNQRAIAVAPLRKLVAAFRETILAAFPPDDTPPHRNSRLGIASDKSGNLWLLEQSRVAVYSGDEWIEAKPAIDEFSTTGGSPQFLSAVGDGSKVYFAAFGVLHGNSLAFLASVHEGKLRLTHAPYGPGSPDALPAFRDREGALWLSGQLGDTATNRVVGIRTTRFSERGALAELKLGAPRLIDGANNVWFVNTNPEIQASRLSTWNDGQIKQQLTLPGSDEVYALFSDRPHSVYAWTTLGLHHLVADQEGPAAGEYRLTTTYALPPAAISGTDWSYSPQLGLILSARTGSGSQLTFFQLPTE